MSKKWISPKAKVQEFVANEYVAACAMCDGPALARLFSDDGNELPWWDVRCDASGKEVRGITLKDGYMTTIREEIDVYIWQKPGSDQWHATRKDGKNYSNAS